MKKLEPSELSFFLSRKYKWIISISLGLFLYIFMAIFLPFGVSNYDPNHRYTLEFLSVLSLFMLNTIAFASANEFFLKPLVLRHITVRNLVLWNLWMLISLGLTNYLAYNLIGNWHDFSLSSAIDFILNVSSVFLFPLIGTFFYFRYKGLKLQYEQILTNNDQSPDPQQLIQFRGQGTNEEILITLTDFLYARAQDNYVELFYVEHQTIKKELLRSTMSKLLQDLKSEYLLRCHRSYMINLYNVRSIKTGSQLTLYLNHISQSIPVSKSFQQEVMQKLKETKSFT